MLDGRLPEVSRLRLRAVARNTSRGYESSAKVPSRPGSLPMKLPPLVFVPLGLPLAILLSLPPATPGQARDRNDPAEPLPSGAIRRIGSARFRGPSIETIAYSPDGRWLAA